MSLSEHRAEFLTPKIAAKIIGKTADWLYRSRKNGHGPPWYRIGGRILYVESEIWQWARKFRTKPNGKSNHAAHPQER